MPKQLNIKLGFEADTSKAKQQIADLQKSLDGLLSKSITNGAFTGFDKDISNAQQSIAKLKDVINNSLNIDTGKLDLSKFSQQLNSSDLTVSKLATDMMAMGGDGQKAFLNLANSIITAQKPMVESNKLLDGMWTALKNTARWQMSSSILHGFVGALEGAYGYAQDLNKSLTDIAIVTGRSTDQMAAFAEQANKSAQELSVSTTAYTDAALIYYQQGLDDEAVKARTDITMQMSNVTGESAEHVSSYMTAIWNNFAEGSENLEHYADVITALGAATASSSEEIANGMQQFAAVADTVGLSYEYAATALATVVAQTRQSESTVGNSFRTIFSRLQGLKLGETLEDGTDLNKYSKALATVGVNIKDQNGELKDMDTILDEIGAKWQMLAKDQQIALAQTVGGVRQYTNLVALFDNWDTFQKNLNVANNSDGALQKQADTYAESWEAAQKRVKAAWQAIYQDLIDEKFFISIANGFSKILKILDAFIDSAGGLPGILSLISAGILNAFGPKLENSLINAQTQLSKILKPSGSKKTYAEINSDKSVDETLQASINNRIKEVGKDTAQQDLIIQSLRQQNVLNKQLRDLRDEISDKEYKELDGLIKITNEYAEQAQKLEEIRRAKSLQAIKSTANIRDKMTDFEADENSEAYAQMNKLLLLDDKTLKNQINTIAIKSDDLDNSIQIDNIVKQYADYGRQVGVTAADIRNFIEDQVELAKAAEQAKNALKAQEGTLKELSEKSNGKLDPNKVLESKDSSKKVGNVINNKELSKTDKGWITKWEKQLKRDQSDVNKIEKEIESIRNSAEEKSAEYMKEAQSAAENGEREQWKAWADKAKEITDEAEKEVNTKLQEMEKLNSQIKETTEKINNKQNQPLTEESNPQPSPQPEQEQPPKNSSEPNLPFFLQEDFAKNILNVTRGISQVTAGLTSLAAIWNVLGDSDMTPLQKLGRILMSIATGLPMLISGLATLSNEQSINAVKATAAGIANLFFAGTEKTVEAATISLAASLGILFAGIMVVVGVIWLIKKAWDAFVATTAEGKLKAAEDELEKQKEKAEAAAEAYNSLTQAISDYKDAKDKLGDKDSGLSDVDKKKLVNDTNAEIYEALNGMDGNWKDLLGIDALEYDDDGLIKLSDKQWEIIKNDQYRVKILEEQKRLQDELAVSAGKKEVDLDSYSGPRFIDEEVTGNFKVDEKSGIVISDGLSYNTQDVDRTGEIIKKLADNGITDLNTILADIETDQQKKSLEIFGDYSEETRQKILDWIKNLNEEEQERVNELLKKFDTDEDLNLEQQARNAYSLSDDFEKYDENSQKALIDAFKGLDENQANSFTETLGRTGDLAKAFDEVGISIDSLNLKYKDLQETEDGHHHLLNINEQDLTHFKGSADDLESEVEQLASYIQENADSLVEFDNSLKDCEKGSQEAAYAIIRFDDAIQDVSENYDEWLEALNSNSLQRTKAAVIDLQKAYGNLLDLDGSQLSSDFVENTNNLKLMQEAVNGNIDSYNKLLDAAAIDNLKTMSIKLDLDEDNLQTVVDDFHNLINSYFPDFEELPVHASLDDADFLAELTNLINTIGFASGEAAEAFLKNMNIDATVVEDTTKTNDTKEIVGADAVPLDAEVIPGAMVGADLISHDISASVPQWEYKPIKTKETESKENTAVALKVTNAKKTMGGNIKHQHSTHGGGGKSSGSCFIAGTQISLSNSYKNIEDIKPGDIVLSYNEKKKKNVFNEVLQTMIHFVHEKIYSLFIKDEKIKATGNHKFLVIHNNNQKWMEVSDIQIGDLVLFSDGTWHEISDINYEVKHETVYNFEVSDTHNYYVGKNQVLAHNKGGGGGKNSAPKKQKREKPVQEKDRYHDLKEKIKDLTTETSRLEKISSRVWGKEKLKYMDQEIKKQEQQIGLTKEYIKEAKNYLAEDKKRLDEIKMGAKYIKDDNTGEWLLTNYEEVLQNIVDAQNKAVDAFNDAKGRYENGEISEDELKAQEEAFNLDKEKFEERKKILKQYEDTYNTVQEQMEKLIDDQWKLYDLKLEKVKVEVELELKVSDQSKKILEWSFKYLGNDLDAVSDKVANLSSQMNYLAQDLATAQKGISGIFATHGINFNWNENTPVDQIVKDLKSQIGGSVYSALTESEVDALMEYMNKLMEVHDAAAEKMKEVMDTFSTAVEKANEKLERQLNRFDGLKSTLTTYQDIVNLTGKNILKITSKNLEDLNKAMIQNDQNKLVSTRAIYETNKGMYEAARAELNEALASGDAQLVEELEEQLNNLEDTMNDALENYRDALKETLEDVQQAWEDALDAMEEAYEDAFGDLGSNWYQEQFDRQKELNELYLPDYKKYHELNKSMTELQKNLANTNNQIVKGKAKELLEDINDKMKSGAQVSEYEAGIIERRVALLKAEDELLAARNAKSTVRMTRDNEGGFSYTYTADEDQINNAQQGYSDAYYELRDYQVTGANDLQSQWLQIQGEFAQRVREIEEQYRDNEAARTEALKQLQTEYQTYVNYFSDQMGVVYKWESTLRDNDLKDLQRVTGLKLDEWDTYITSWNDTLLNTVIPGYDTYDQLLNTWDKAMNTAITSVNKAHDNYRKNVEVTMNKAGMSVNGFKEQFEKDMANVQLDSDQTTSNIRTLTETTMTNFGKALAKVSGFTQDYLANFYKIREDNEDTIISIQGIITALSGLNTSMDTANEKARTLKTDTVTTISSALTEMANAFDSVAESARGAGTEIDNTRAKEEAYGNEMVKVTYEGKTSVMQRKYVPSGWTILGPAFDTGGYTGDWHSSEGRPAILHEKELVLNKEDTKNMLDAVNVIRSMQTPINGLARNMFNYNSLNNVGSADTLEQQVHIDATFPNVSDHNEIELALNNLVNSASQYVNRK